MLNASNVCRVVVAVFGCGGGGRGRGGLHALQQRHGRRDAVLLLSQLCLPLSSCVDVGNLVDSRCYRLLLRCLPQLWSWTVFLVTPSQTR